MTTPTDTGYRRRLFALSSAMLLPSLGTSIANVALPSLASSFGASFADVQWVVVSYLLSVTALVVGAGRLGDLFGRRRLLLAGLVVFAGASLAAALSHSLWMLIAARAMQGAGSALVMALTMAAATDAAPSSRTGSIVGLLGTVSAAGTALGPALGGALIAWFGWPAIFAVMAGAAAVVFALNLGLPAPTSTAPRPPTISGTLLSQGRALSPALAALMLVTAIVMATLIVGPFYLTNVAGLSVAQTGLTMSLGPLVAALSGLPAGRLVDRLGARAAALAGLVIVAAGSMTMVLLPALVGVAGYAIALVLITAGYALFQAANNTSIMRSAPSGQRGVVSALLGLARNLGLIGGASAMGAVFSFGSHLWTGPGSPPNALTVSN